MRLSLFFICGVVGAAANSTWAPSASLDTAQSEALPFYSYSSYSYSYSYTLAPEVGYSRDGEIQSYYDEASCFEDPGEGIPGCECHASCATCGYYNDPTAVDDCITCADGGAVVPAYDDGTGTCPRYSYSYYSYAQLETAAPSATRAPTSTAPTATPSRFPSPTCCVSAGVSTAW